MSHRNHGNHRKLLAARVNGLASLVGGVVRSAGKERGFLLRCKDTKIYNTLGINSLYLFW